MNHFTLPSLAPSAIASVPPNVDYVHIEQQLLAPIPASLAELPKIKGIQFRHCKVQGFDLGARMIGSSNVELLFDNCELDDDALFDLLLEHGPGTWVINIQNGKSTVNKRFKLLHEIGNDGAGDRAYRLQCLSLIEEGAKKRLFPSSLPAVATQAELRFLTHSKKKVRELGLVYLERALPSLLEGGAEAPRAFFIAGKPLYFDASDLAAKLAALGIAVVTDPKKASHALVLSDPKDKLDRALSAKLPVVLEAHLRTWIESGGANAATGKPSVVAPARIGGDEAQDVESLLQSPDSANRMLGLKLLKATELTGDRFPTLLALTFFHPDKAIRETTKALLIERGPRPMVERLQGDRRNYVAMSDAAKFIKLARELEKQLGVDPAAFMDRVILLACQRGTYFSTRDFLEAAGTFDPSGAYFRHLCDQTSVLIWKMKKSLPVGLGHLTKLQRLATSYGTLSSSDNMDVLLDLPDFFYLDVMIGTKVSSLKILSPLRDKLRMLTLGNCEVLDMDFTPLESFTKLETLNIGLSAGNARIALPPAALDALKKALPNCTISV